MTGVLPIGLEKATRAMEYLLKGGKEYVCLMHLHKPVAEEKIRKVIPESVGVMMQKPPVRSAVKRVERMREIYYLEILETDGQDVLFVMGCEAGTYVRKYCVDVGKKLGVGAHMQQLVRTKAGPFNEGEWYSLHDVQDAFTLWKEKGDESLLRRVIKPAEFAVSHLPKVWVMDSAVDTLCHGANLSVPGIVKGESEIEKNEKVGVFTLKGELIAVGSALMSSVEVMKNEKGLAVKIEKTFMDPEVYPHYHREKKEVD